MCLTLSATLSCIYSVALWVGALRRKKKWQPKFIWHTAHFANCGENISRNAALILEQTALMLYKIRCEIKAFFPHYLLGTMHARVCFPTAELPFIGDVLMNFWALERLTQLPRKAQLRRMKRGGGGSIKATCAEIYGKQQCTIVHVSGVCPYVCSWEVMSTSGGIWKGMMRRGLCE